MTDQRTTPMRIQLRRTRGWKMPPSTVKVDRTTMDGNPFRVGKPVDKLRLRDWHLEVQRTDIECPDQKTAVALFAGAMERLHPIIRQLKFYGLRGKNLACWCKLCELHKNGKPGGVECDDCEPCHADVMLEIANAE